MADIEETYETELNTFQVHYMHQADGRVEAYVDLFDKETDFFIQTILIYPEDISVLEKVIKKLKRLNKKKTKI